MKTHFIKIITFISLILFTCSCYNDCSDFEAMGAPTFKFDITKLDSSEVDASLIKIAYQGDTINSVELQDNRIQFQVNEPPAIKDKTAFEDSLFVFYNDTLRSKVKLGIAKTKGTCYSVYKLSKVTVDDSTFCTSNCTNKVYEVRF